MERPEIPYPRQAAIKARAATTVKRYGCKAPVDLLAIIDQEDELDLANEDLGDALLGSIQYDDETGTYHICINSNEHAQDPQRARFTLAHELAHYFIDEHMEDLSSGRVPQFRVPSKVPAELLAEKEADLFASYLLVPETEFKAAVAGKRASLGLVKDLAEHFQVSVQCAAIRYIDTTDQACAIAVFPKSACNVPWVEVSQPFKQTGVTRLSRLKRRLANSTSSLLGDWFEDVLPSRQNTMVFADAINGSHDYFAFLRI